MVKKIYQNENQNEEYLKYYIFERASGRKIIEFSNYSEKAVQEKNSNLKCLGLLVKEANQDDDEEEDYYNEDEEDDADEAGSVEEEFDEDDEESDPAYEGGDISTKNINLEIGFFFVTDQGQKKDKDQMFCMTMDLEALKDYYNDNDGLIYITNVLAQNHYATHGDSKCFDIPKSWFVNQKNEEEPW